MWSVGRNIVSAPKSVVAEGIGFGATWKLPAVPKVSMSPPVMVNASARRPSGCAWMLCRRRGILAVELASTVYLTGSRELDNTVGRTWCSTEQLTSLLLRSATSQVQRQL
jgi:hypothetical protein